MFPATLARSSNGHCRRVLIVALATVMLFAVLVVVPGAPEAQADPLKTGTITFLFRHSNGDTELVSEDFIAETGQTYFFVGAGGASATNPTGMPVHVSCSDEFTNGWSDISGGRPDPNLDPEWYVIDFYIDKDGPAAGCGNPDILRVPSIDIEKATNGEDADTPTGPTLTVGDPVTWTYVVTNTGDVELTIVEVTDDIEGTICTIGDLAVGETDTCTATGVATLGQYANMGTVTGFYPAMEQEVTDTDPSHYVGVEQPPPLVPGIDIEKATNGEDADTPTGPTLTVGDPVTWTYVVTNTGDVDLTNVEVTDDIEGTICTIGDLAVGEVRTCEKVGAALLVNYANMGTVTGFYPQGETEVTDTDPSHYAGVAVLGTAQLGDTVWYDSNKNGVQDSGESGINGATVLLKDADGTVIASLTTATGAWDGFYKFLELDAGTYTATLDMSSVKSTYELTTAGAFTITLEDGDDYVDADFGLYEEELPKTGLDSEGLTLLALGLLMLGALAVISSRSRRAEER